MKIKNLAVILFVFCALIGVQAQQKKYIVHTVAFYNFENLFDTINNPNMDEEWLPNGLQRWTSEKYKQKLENLIVNRMNSDEAVYPFGDYFGDENFKVMLDKVLVIGRRC